MMDDCRDLHKCIITQSGLLDALRDEMLVLLADQQSALSYL